MKKIYALLAIVAIIAVSNCTKIPENNDPVIGIWYKVTVENSETTEGQTIRKEWIFNDVYLGRYQEYESNRLVFKTDFRWNSESDHYTISYPGTEMQEVQVSMKREADKTVLEDPQGNILAERE